MLLCINSMMAQFNGFGTQSEPYLISSQQDLDNFVRAVNNGNSFSGKFFKQTADIDLVDSQIFSDGFTPIGNENNPFSGTYDGDGHSISKLTISGYYNAAMFGCVYSGCVKNLNFENVNIAVSGDVSVAAVAVALAYNSTFSNITASGQLAASDRLNSVTLAGIVGTSTSSTISGCVSMLSFDVDDVYSDMVRIAGITYSGGQQNTVSNCLVSTFIRGEYENYFPISDNGTISKCVIAESNGVPSELSATYSNCYFDHQNTIIATFPNQQFFIDGFDALPTTSMTSGALFNDEAWTETAGLYPRPASVANTGIAILAASPMILNTKDCITSVSSNFMVSTQNNVLWHSESECVQISGTNATVTHRESDLIAEICAYRNSLMKTLQITVLNNAYGTKVNPILLSTADDFFALSDMRWDILLTDSTNLDLLYEAYANGELYFLVDSDVTLGNWTPIGSGSPFRCHFDGGNHTITIDSLYGDSYYYGLFSQIEGADISNVTVNYVAVPTNGYSQVGGISAYATSSVISNCKVMGQLYDYFYPEDFGFFGGFVAVAEETSFYNCVNAAELYMYAGDVGVSTGGIVGKGTNVALYSCTNLGYIHGYPDQGYVGSLIGEVNTATIVGCANFADMELRDEEPGAFIGQADDVIFQDCANYGGNFVPFAYYSSNMTFINSINVPGNTSSIGYDRDIATIFDRNATSDQPQYLFTNNYTDIQIVPATGHGTGIRGLLTSELTSASAESLNLDPNKWTFINGRYPVPSGTEYNNDLAILATTPFFLSANSGDDYETINAIRTGINLNSGNNIVWLLDSTLVVSGFVDLDSLRQDSVSVPKSIVATLGDQVREYGFLLAPRVATPENPLLIESLSDFNEFAQVLAYSGTNSGESSPLTRYKGVNVTNYGAGLSFKLTADISASDANISMISRFSGNFNGGGHTITLTTSDLSGTNVSSSPIGLFCTIERAKIDSLNILVESEINLTSNTDNYTSLLCGRAINSVISNCNVTLNADFRIGEGAAICGKAEQAEIKNCNILGTASIISTSGNYVAGFVSNASMSTITNCTNNVDVSSTVTNTARIGGIVAKAYSLIVENCANNSNLSGGMLVAGIVSEFNSGSSQTLPSKVLCSTNSGIISGQYASGIVGNVYGYSGGMAILEVGKCMNSGVINGSLYSAAGIISKLEDVYEVSVSNCANYGSVSCNRNITGIAPETITCSGNIVASNFSNSYNNNNYTQDVISPNADADDFFDEQITEIKVDSLRLRFYDNGTPRTTQMMVSSAFAEELPGDWDFIEGLYPLPVGLDPNDPRNKLARLPIILKSDGVGRSERITSVLTNITLPQVDGVTWESSNPDVISVPSDGGVAEVTNPSSDAEVTITATCEGVSRSFTFTVHSADGVSADNPIILSSCRDILYNMCNNENYPSGGYGFYFKLGDNVEINRYDIGGDVDDNFYVNLENINVLFPSTYPFHGHFDGDGYSIKWQNAEYEGDYYGLFKYAEGAEISNLTMYYNDNGNYNYSGTLVGHAKYTTIRNCAVYSSLSATDRVGGIADKTSDGTVISNCIFVGELSSKNIGGIVAYAIDTRIDNSISMLRKSFEGETLETGGAIVLSGENVVVDSCLVIGDNNYGRINVVSAYNESVTASNCYYDKQMWIPADGDTINNIGVTTSELVENGLFNWSHSEGKYPVPAGAANLSSVTLVATPMLIGADDDVMHVTELGISNDDDVQWAVNNTNAIVGYSVTCVEEPESAEIVATYSDGTLSDQALYYNFTREITVTKGIVDVPENIGFVCEGGDFALSVNGGGAVAYSWNLPEGLTADSYDTQSVTVHVDDNYLRDNDPENISVDVSFDGCVVPKEIEFSTIPSPSHYRVNDTAVCTGSDLTVNCVLDEGYEEYSGNFFLSWYDASDMNNLLTDDSISASYYIPILTEDRNLRIVARSIEGNCLDTLDVALSVNPASSITVVSGETNQQICEGEPIEPIIFSVANPTYALPYGVYAEYDTTNNLLTLTGYPSNTYNSDNTYTISSCGSEFNGIMDVSYFRSRAMSNQSLVVNLGEEVDMIFYGEYNLGNIITWESLDGSETFTTEELGLTISSSQDETSIISHIEGTAEMPGEYIFHITIPAYENCPSIVYDNFLGVYDNSDLIATAIDTTICIGETATLTTVERPGAYGGEYVWTVGNDTIGLGNRIDVIPQQTTTYNVLCGGKRMVGDFEIGDYVYWDEDLSESGYSMEKYFEYNTYHNETGYLIVNIEEDSLLLMTLARMEEVEWSQASAMLAADDMGYLPSAGEFGNVIDNYQRFMTFFRENSINTAILTSTEKDANTVYAFNPIYGLILEHPKTETALALGFKKIGKNEIVNMVGRTSDISRTGSIDIIVSERHDMAIITDDVLCNTDTARVGINTDYTVLNWYNVTNPETEIMFDEDIAVLTDGIYLAVASDEYGSCTDSLEVKVKDLAFYIPQDTTVCDTAIFTIAKEDVIVMLNGEAIEGQTLVLNETGTYTIALVGVGDTCREEKILNLTVNRSYWISFDTIVYDSAFVWNEETYTATGNYTQFFTTINGCDSIVTANVTFVNTENEFALFGIVTESDGTTPLSGVEVSSDGTAVTTLEDGRYLIMIQRTNPIVHFSKQGYSIICDSVSGGGEYNVSMFKPEISVSMSDDSYETTPYVARQVVVELSNTGDGPLAWSSVVESDFTAPGRSVHPRSNSQMWDYADEVIVTNSSAEQAIATDGFYIYTASWRRAGEFSRYSPDNGYLETFVIDGVGGVRNLSYGNGFFFATDNTNKIYKINMDTQTLEDVITLNDPDLQIRYCAYSTEEDLLYIGNWTNLYKLVAYNTAYPTLIPLSYSMNNVYSIAYDAFSGSEPCLWAFSQISENNGPFAKIYKLNANGGQIAEMEHFINDASLATSSSLAGGICASQYLYDDKYVLLANIQNSESPNKIAVYEIGGKSSWVIADTKSGIIPAGESINVTITEMATENGIYSAVVKFKPNVYMPENSDLNLSLAVSSPTCSPVENLVAVTDTFHTVSLSWDAVDAGEYESVSYMVYEQGSDVALDTVQTTSYIVENPEIGERCYYVRTLMRGETDCVSNPSNTACAEILAFPCDVQLSLTARAYGDRIRLEWNDLYGVTSYGVFEDVEGGEGLYIGTEPFFEDTLALPETDYCYKVVAYFRNDECGPKTSNSACARISAGGCSEVPVVIATAVGNSVALSWGKIQGVQSYSLYKDGKYLTSTSDTAYYDMMLEYETEYCYVVEINCGYGMFGLSDEVCVTTEKEYEEQNAVESITDESIDLYPNPASDRFYIGGQTMKSIAVVNFAGQLVYELDNIMDDNIVIETERFVTGVYAIRITLADGKTIIKRVVISK